jgi:hypothetical protein
MSLDFTYLPRIPPDKIEVYRSLENATRRLQQDIQGLTFTQAQVNDELAERLLAFWAALEDAQRALGENEPKKLLDTVDALRRCGPPWADWPARLLGCESRAFVAGVKPENRIEKAQVLVKRVLDDVHRSEVEDELWHHMKKRVSEYADALLAALNPGGATENRRNQWERPRWDGVRLWYGDQVVRSYQRKAAPNQAKILAALEAAGWPDTPVPVDKECGSTLSITLHRINEKIKDRIICLQSAGEGGKSVIWKKMQV